MNPIFTMEGVKKTIFGAGALQEVGEACKSLKISRALLVMDRDLSKMDICSSAREPLSEKDSRNKRRYVCPVMK
jgi:alcohol dehydrogenase class IV